ncbi:MAG: nucleotidyl transferase AbiEii/AbiGii toxin family protein [Anaerolineae bacterium]|nr:nucleotidyl transferase AbiEii/AbiGii toxin family protein [Anaerolineae bacterium]
MISVAEIRRRAAGMAGGEAMVERDYLLSWVLKALYEADALRESFVLKGGTALRKLYFPQTRFSVDLDFTLVKRVAEARLRAGLLDLGTQVELGCGLEFMAPRFRFEKVKDEYEAETFEARLYFRRLVHPGGAPLSAVVDATYNEVIVLPIEERPLFYDYSDVADFGTVIVRAYSLEEIATEKLRGLLFQRVNPSPRDAYDLWYLWANGAVDWEQVVSVFPQKCASRGIPIEGLLPDVLHRQEAAIRGVWGSTLSGLIGTYPPFEEAWGLISELVARLSRPR